MISLDAGFFFSSLIGLPDGIHYGTNCYTRIVFCCRRTTRRDEIRWGPVQRIMKLVASSDSQWIAAVVLMAFGLT